MSLPVPSLPNQTGAFSITAGGDTLNLPHTFDSDDENRGVRSFSNTLDGSDGSIKTRDAAFDPISIEITGYMFSANDVQRLRRIIGYKRVTLSRGSRTLIGDVVGFSTKVRVENKIWVISLTVESNWYYWLGEEIESDDDPTSVVNNGDLLIYPTITFTGGSGGATKVGVTMSGRELTYTGSVGLDEVLVIDCENLTATLEGDGALSGMNAGFFTTTPYLLPGANDVTLDVTGAGTTVITFSERYL